MQANSRGSRRSMTVRIPYRRSAEAIRDPNVLKQGYVVTLELSIYVGKFIDEQARIGDPGMMKLVGWDTPRRCWWTMSATWTSTRCSCNATRRVR